MQNINVIDQLAVLDNKVKLRILALLADTGAKSITDISKILNLNFSTAHKYLEQLERVGFVKSKQETENRLKRMFYIQEFYINLTPRNVSKILRGEHIERGDSPYGDFDIITDDGNLEPFNELKFAKKYLDFGIPKYTLDVIFSSIKNQLYNGITLIELREIFIRELNNRLKTITSALTKIGNESDTYFDFINKKHKSLINKHMAGDIFISNLNNNLINFVHDLKAISDLGFEKRPTNLQEFLAELVKVTNKVNVAGPQLYDSFNYFIAKYTEGLSEETIREHVTKFVTAIKHPYISLELGVPTFINKLKVDKFDEKNKEDYSKYNNIALKLVPLLVNILRRHNVKIVFKLWPDYDSSNLMLLPGDYLVNMSLDWQKENATYLGNSRFDSSWKYWQRTVRIGEAQNVNINLPRLAMHSKNLDVFQEELNQIISDISLMLNDSYKYLMVNTDNLTLAGTRLKSISLYTHIDDSNFVISLCGMNEALNFLNVNTLDTKARILTELNKLIKTKIAPNLRVGISGVCSDFVAKRFSELDSKKYNLSLNKYETNVTTKLEEGIIHELLSAGHYVNVKRDVNIKDILKNKVGAVRIDG